jgi:hypothetical protein
MVAGERPAGAVGAMQARREPDDQQPVAHGAEGRHGPAVVIRMRDPHGVQVARETRAEPAARLESPAGADCPAHRALNCASSVEPRIAVSDELPPVTVCVTSSKYPAPTSRWCLVAV